MRFLFYIVLGFLPGLFWMFFYLRKDKKPESKVMVLKIFIWGMLIAPVAVIAAVLLTWALVPTANPIAILFGNYKVGILRAILIATIVPAITEEYLKYAVVKVKAIRHSEFDEPTDAMIYCIISGLGFASVENLLAVFSLPYAPLREVLGVIFFRFLGATLLHALASAIIGYWLAMSILYLKQRKKLLLKGIVLAVIFHACYDYLIFLIIKTPTEALTQQKINLVVMIIAALLISMAVYVSGGFRRLKKQQSVCKI